MGSEKIIEAKIARIEIPLIELIEKTIRATVERINTARRAKGDKESNIFEREIAPQYTNMSEADKMKKLDEIAQNNIAEERARYG